MIAKQKKSERIVSKSQSRIPKSSFFFQKGVPLLLGIMAIVTLGLIVFAAGVLLGFVNF